LPAGKLRTNPTINPFLSAPSFFRFLRRIVPPPQVTNLQSTNQPQKAVKLAAQMVASLPTFHDFQENGSGGGGHLATPIWSLANEVFNK
jgi:hypothetical protein